MGTGSRAIQAYRRAALIAALFAAGCAASREIRSPSLPLEAPRRNEVRYVFYVLHADAQEIADTLVEMLEASRRTSISRNVGFCAFMTREFWDAQKSGPQPKGMECRIVADSKTNSIVITLLATELDDVPRMRELIRRLDQDLCGSPAVH